MRAGCLAVLLLGLLSLAACSEEKPLSAGSLAGKQGRRLDAAPPPPEKKALPAPPKEEGEVLELGFAELASFKYRPPDPYADEPAGDEKERLPVAIRAYDGRRASIEGYMVPVRTRGSRVETFVLSRFIGGCCFGRMPRMNEGVEISLPKGETVEYIPHGVILVTGVLRVGEVKDEFGYVTSVYRMQAESVE